MITLDVNKRLILEEALSSDNLTKWDGLKTGAMLGGLTGLGANLSGAVIFH